MSPAYATAADLGALEARMRAVETGRTADTTDLRHLARAVEKLEATQTRLVWAVVSSCGMGGLGVVALVAERLMGGG